MASIQFTGTNAAEVETFTGGKIMSNAFDGTLLISADKQVRHKLTPGCYVTKQGAELLVAATPFQDSPS